MDKPMETVDKVGPVHEVLQEIGKELLASGCPCACVCHRAGTRTFRKCQCCEHGNKVWSIAGAVR